ncbi:hypothetical protein EJ02DRAFT_258697 [Clathrospora elynae]|uniref:CRIB domain-containing protein n=1 Tax=Clathrospora elynae TaxID=706981 RepID=A0A6A5SGU9_9PLEO|nr:hypothetical protein EJ02DRAFT_258697 [Clathrospora elynae]
MFSYSGSDAISPSRQSSIDSQATEPTTSSAGSDIHIDQCSGSPFAVAMHSPEQQHKFHAAKRSSVFNLRSRSNTASSTTPSLLSLGHSDMAEHDASWYGPLPGPGQAGNESQKESSVIGPRRSLFRGRKGKRLSEAVVSGIDVGECEGDGSARRMSILRKSRRQHSQAEAYVPSLIHRISSPFDFQHLSHTNRHQVTSFENFPGDNLAAGSFFVSTSERPHPGLPGSQVDNIYFNNFSSDNLAAVDDRSPTVLGSRSSPHSPELRHEWQRQELVPHAAISCPALRSTRSVESFSQPGVSPRKHIQSQSVATLPRTSSRLSLAPFSDTTETVHEVGTITRRSSRSKRESGIWDSFSLSAVSTPEQLPGVHESSSYFGHALTTPDESAIPAMTPPFSPSLADVAEEPEKFFSPRTAPQPLLKTPTSPKSPHFESFTFHSQRSPITKLRSRGHSQTSPKSMVQTVSNIRPISQTSDTLGSFSQTRKGSVRRLSASRRQSNTWRVMEESWEDDVDYIYDNALEADCEFEWDRSSVEGVYHRQQPEVAQTQHQDPTSTAHGIHTRSSIPKSDSPTHESFSFDLFRTSLLVPSTSSVPELVPTSAISSSTISTGLQTPSDTFNTNRLRGDGTFSFSPSLLVPQEYKDTHEVTYEDLLDEYAGSDRHFPMLDANQSTTSSARSSHVRLSRRSSYDSSIMSSAQSSGLWSSPIRRSASSAGSVPELVPSRRSRKELGSSLTVDQFEGYNEEEGMTPAGRTFFASGDDVPHISIESELKASLDLARRGSHRHNHTAVEEELKASLDLARQGSQRSSRGAMRHHKYAMSDGAAKLLSPVIKDYQTAGSRNRAASTTQPRSPMLSLFPAPPRTSPTPNRF